MAHGTRRHARESALQALYLMDLCKDDPDGIPRAAWSEKPLELQAQEFARRLAHGVRVHESEIDAVIVRYTENWALDRMAAIDRSVLRMAAYELLYDLETPVSVVINEAIEIAKKFSTAESSKFVNGILDKVKQERKSIKE